VTAARPGVATARQVQGKELSYNNINDTDAAYELRRRVRRPESACVIVKHANPCGVAVGPTSSTPTRKPMPAIPSRLRRHRRGEPPLDAAKARAKIVKLFTEVVIAPDATRRGAGDLRRQEEPAPAAGRRPARSRPPA
jgi:phosphoribosylaminoimidazolecarboxamide formyltransferase/IMP cyclohydrolase